MRIPNYIKRGLTVVGIFGLFYVTRTYVLGWIQTVYTDLSVNGLLAEVIGGLTTSIIIFLFYFILIPIIEISPKILRYDDGFYRLKIYNSSVFAAYEVSAILTKVTPIKAPKGKKNVHINDVQISLPYLEYLPSMYNLESRRTGNTFAIVYKVEDPNEDILKVLSDKKDTSYYRLTISCKNGFTGLRKIITENYTYKSSVIDKMEFDSGATFKKV